MTPAYLLYRSRPVAIYYSEMFAGGPKNYSYLLNDSDINDILARIL